MRRIAQSQAPPSLMLRGRPRIVNGLEHRTRRLIGKPRFTAEESPRPECECETQMCSFAYGL